MRHIQFKTWQTVAWSVVFLGTLCWSAIAPKDGLTWFLEAAPAMVGALLLVCTRSRFPLTPMLYFWVLAHCVVLMVGAKYTYAEVPLFDAISELFGWQRNNYDKLGHFMQGFVPALLTRELLVRKRVVSGGWWLNFIIVSICLAFSAFYELVEWWAAVLIGEDADAFLGTQGYVWDTQSDMAWAAFGAFVCVMTLARAHDRQLSKLIP
mgnify:CR=1 FL=1